LNSLPKEKNARFRIENRQFQHPETKEFPDGNELLSTGQTVNDHPANHSYRLPPSRDDLFSEVPRPGYFPLLSDFAFGLFDAPGL
jgi:hypothetical protein